MTERLSRFRKDRQKQHKKTTIVLLVCAGVVVLTVLVAVLLRSPESHRLPATRKPTVATERSARRTDASTPADPAPETAPRQSPEPTPQLPLTEDERFLEEAKAAHARGERLDRSYRKFPSRLHMAASKGYPKATVRLLETGLPVDLGIEKRGSPLKFAADRGHVEVVKLLVERGADVTAGDESKSMGTAIHTALNRPHRDVVLWLVEHADLTGFTDLWGGHHVQHVEHDLATVAWQKNLP